MSNTGGIGLSLGTVTIGAILAFAITASTPGISLPAVGTILMVMGMVGFVTCLYLDWSRRRPQYDSYSGRGYDETAAYERRY